jgi:hypothetical protein
MVFGLRGVEFTLPCKADAEDEVGGGWLGSRVVRRQRRLRRKPLARSKAIRVAGPHVLRDFKP